MKPGSNIPDNALNLLSPALEAIGMSGVYLDLDEMVYDAFSEEASKVNNAGESIQVYTLLAMGVITEKDIAEWQKTAEEGGD